MVIKALINPGDECIIIEPYWRAYEMMILLSDGVPIKVHACASNGFQLEIEKILSKVTKKTKAIIINSPNNPSGAVYSPSTLKKIAHDAASRGIYLISDEVYEEITYDNPHYSTASDESVFDWMISAFSFSKTYAMTGLRIGYVVASKKIINELLKLSQFTITSLSTSIQHGAIMALCSQEVKDYVQFMRQKYQVRRDHILNLASNTWLEKAIIKPQGAIYAFINTSEFNTNSLNLAKNIVRSNSIAFTPGIAFGDSMDGYLRMSLTTSLANITKSVEALKKMQKTL